MFVYRCMPTTMKEVLFFFENKRCTRHTSNRIQNTRLETQHACQQNWWIGVKCKAHCVPNVRVSILVSCGPSRQRNAPSSRCHNKRPLGFRASAEAWPTSDEYLFVDTTTVCCKLSAQQDTRKKLIASSPNTSDGIHFHYQLGCQFPQLTRYSFSA